MHKADGAVLAGGSGSEHRPDWKSAPDYSRYSSSMPMCLLSTLMS